MEAAEARARRMYESTPAMLHSVDRHGRLVAVSDQWLAKLGYSRAEVIGRSARELHAPDSGARAAQGLAQLQQTQLHSTAQVADLQACNARLTQQLRVCPSCPSPALDPSSAPLPPAAP